MVDVAIRHAWMQKHPTPTRSGGDFHWHPQIPAPIASALSELASRTGGEPASLWLMSPRFVAWARTFSATAPGEQRRYTGIAASIAQPRNPDEWSQALPDALDRLELPPAAPFGGSRWDDVDPKVTSVSDAIDLWPIDTDALSGLFPTADSHDAVARAVVAGGQAQCAAPHDDRLPTLFGQMLSWLPAAERTATRSGAFVAAATDSADPPGKSAAHMFHYLAGAWFCPRRIRARDPLYGVAAWRLVLELAASLRLDLPALFHDLTRVAGAWDRATQLSRHLVESGALTEQHVAQCDARAPRPLFDDAVEDAGWLWNRLVHYWGRGFFGEHGDAEVFVRRLGALLAMRITADHLFHLDAPNEPDLPRRYLRRLDYEAIAPRARVASLRGALTRFLPSLNDE